MTSKTHCLELGPFALHLALTRSQLGASLMVGLWVHKLGFNITLSTID